MLRRPGTDDAARKEARKAAGRDISTPEARRAARQHVLWRDHGILRTFWTNFGEVAPGVYRSNHPDHARLTRYRKMGIKAVLNLRGTPQMAHHLFEVESCAELGLDLVSVALHARRPAKKEEMQRLFAAFDQIARPFVMHCKSGADRAGLAAALYLLDQGAPIDRARKELSLRYLHLRFTKTGVQDHMLDLFEARQAQGTISVRDWVAREYDPDVLAQSFARQRILPV